MTRAGSLLLTGSTGMAGRAIKRGLFTRTDVQLTLLLHAPGRGLSGPRVLREVFRLEPTPPLIRRVRLVQGDLTNPGLGLPSRENTDLAPTVDGIIHAAATTR